MAYEDTAIKTERWLGLRFGAGVYFNYAFMLLWCLDCLSWWTSSQLVRRTSPQRVLLDGFMFFIVVNAVIVFEDGWLRHIGLFACLILLLLLIRRLIGKKSTATQASNPD